jgi:hypothetical protein
VLDFRWRRGVEPGRQRVCVMWFRSAVLATALVSLSLPAFARGGLSGARKWRELLPTVRATTDCLAQGIVTRPTALSHARQENWLEAVKSLGDECTDVGRTLVTEHDRLYGPSTGKAFVEGPYASDLPRALKARIGPEMKRQAAQPATAEEAPIPAITATETNMLGPPPVLVSRESGEADGMSLGRDEPKAVALTSPETAVIKEPSAAEAAAPPVARRTADVVTSQSKLQDENRLSGPVYPNRAYSLAVLALFAAAALFATGRALGWRVSRVAQWRWTQSNVSRSSSNPVRERLSPSS